MLVYVINKNGNPLMPCKPAKARHLLETNKAVVVKRTPFTIQLTWDCEDNRQPVTLGVDSGYENIGLSVTTDKEEVFSAEVKLRTDIVKLNSERRMCRRTRRNRKTRYRKPRFLNRRIKTGWLAPSIQHKLDSHIKVIDMAKKILPITKITVEVAAFDIQKIKNPDIEGVEYQNGEQSGFRNVKEYVLYRDGHICQRCKGKSGDKILEVHHIESRQTGGDRPANLITLCRTCHDKVTQGNIKLKIKPSKGFKAETFMTMVRWRIIDKLRELGNNVSHTYGYITKSRRRELGIEKSHSNDAFVIAKGTNQTRLNGYLIKQARRCNRKLYKGIRSHIKNTAPRFVHGFQRFDKVLWNGVECFIFGRRSSGYFALRDLVGNSLNASVRYTNLELLESFKTMLIERKGEAVSSPA
ncbi:HNH endonuclease [Candidatus Dojkabacteria bacterium]|nr:HNH endonuclease [Candidatus Dojkabacteria bacterium]